MSESESTESKGHETSTYSQFNTAILNAGDQYKYCTCFLSAAMNQQRITQSAPVKPGGQLPPSSHGQMRLQQMEKERLRLKQQELLRQRPQVRKPDALYLQKDTRSILPAPPRVPSA